MCVMYRDTYHISIKLYSIRNVSIVPDWYSAVMRTFLKQYSCYESATIGYTGDHQYLAQQSEIINNLPEIPFIFCNYAVRSCGTWRKGAGQSPCNALISDLELYVTEMSMGVCEVLLLSFTGSQCWASVILGACSQYHDDEHHEDIDQSQYS